MEAGGIRMMEKLKDITECSICLKTFTDPRMLPCIHTFCLKCLDDFASKSEKTTIPCPICRREFIVPMEGCGKIQKNFFMEKLTEVSRISGRAEDSLSACDLCERMGGDGSTAETSPAEVYCVDCRENLCGDCARRHRVQKLSADHKIVAIGTKIDEEELKLKDFFKPSTCDQHPSKPLDYYCADCKRVVCVSCFVENHNSHKCSDVSKVSEGFGKAIGRDLDRVRDCSDLRLRSAARLKEKREKFLRDVDESERAIVARSVELKEIVDRQTKTLLESLTSVKQTRLKEIDIDREEMDTQVSILENFEIYCRQLISKGSPGDICRSVNEIHERTEEMEEAFCRSGVTTTIKVSFRVASFEDFLNPNNENVIGSINVSEFEKSMVIVGLDFGETMTEDVWKVSLRHSDGVSNLDPIPTRMRMEAVAAAEPDGGALFVTGVGRNEDEIWKYDGPLSEWTKCGTLVHGRRRHCATFAGVTLYVCGGIDAYDSGFLDSVEAFDPLTGVSTAVGRLSHAVYSAAAVAAAVAAYDGHSIYVFGGDGTDDEPVDFVQVYDTVDDRCTLLTTPLPRACSHARAASWGKSVVVLDRDTCFVFDVETATWSERERFKTDVVFFGLIVENDTIFVFGGGNSETAGVFGWTTTTWKCRDDVRCVAASSVVNDRPTSGWKIHARLPSPSLIHAYGKIILPFVSIK